MHSSLTTWILKRLRGAESHRVASWVSCAFHCTLFRPASRVRSVPSVSSQCLRTARIGSVPLPDIDNLQALHLRKAAMRDVEPMLQLIAHWARRGAMLPKSRDVLYKEIRDFYLLETQDSSIAGTVGLHILWSDLAEVRSLAIHPSFQGHGLGKRLVLGLEGEARELGILRLFAWTLEPAFFVRCGYEEIGLELLPPKVYKEYAKSAMLKRI